ncbi:MAG TPA: ATP-binding protein [Bryobacteraceae bacterium]|jgi:two-component system sensor histidine kinase CpxA
MKSLFLKIFLWFCAANAVVICATLLGYELSNPDQLPFSWPRVGKGAIVSAARTSIDIYERSGSGQLTSYLEVLEQDTGLEAGLFDSSKHQLGTRAPSPKLPDEMATYPAGQLMIRLRGRAAGVRLAGSSGRSYLFVATVPRREASGFWSRTFLLSFSLTGALLCYLLARYITAPMIHLRAVTSMFSCGDLTARITLPGVLQRQDEIGGLAGDFNQMAARIETLVKAQQRLIADVSHELRSPITRLSLALGLVRRRQGGDIGVPLARIEREVERLNTLIGQLLTLSRLEGVDKSPPMEILDLSALVKEISADADFEAASMSRGVQLVECDACSMLGARDLIRSAVENVVRNAVKYTAPNTDVLVTLSNMNHEGMALVVVQDHGPGAPVEALPHIFEPFYRVDDARDRRSGGSGLGLAITHQIVKLHGGSVCAVNRDGGGLELRVTLPVVEMQT